MPKAGGGNTIAHQAAYDLAHEPPILSSSAKWGGICGLWALFFVIGIILAVTDSTIVRGKWAPPEDIDFDVDGIIKHLNSKDYDKEKTKKLLKEGGSISEMREVLKYAMCSKKSGSGARCGPFYLPNANVDTETDENSGRSFTIVQLPFHVDDDKPVDVDYNAVMAGLKVAGAALIKDPMAADSKIVADKSGLFQSKGEDQKKKKDDPTSKQKHVMFITYDDIDTINKVKDALLDTTAFNPDYVIFVFVREVPAMVFTEEEKNNSGKRATKKRKEFKNHREEMFILGDIFPKHDVFFIGVRSEGIYDQILDKMGELADPPAVMKILNDYLYCHYMACCVPAEREKDEAKNFLKAYLNSNNIEFKKILKPGSDHPREKVKPPITDPKEDVSKKNAGAVPVYKGKKDESGKNPKVAQAIINAYLGKNIHLMLDKAEDVGSINLVVFGDTKKEKLEIELFYSPLARSGKFGKFYYFGPEGDFGVGGFFEDSQMFVNPGIGGSGGGGNSMALASSSSHSVAASISSSSHSSDSSSSDSSDSLAAALSSMSAANSNSESDSESTAAGSSDSSESESESL